MPGPSVTCPLTPDRLRLRGALQPRPPQVTFSHNVEDVVQVVESFGVAILAIGGLAVLLHSAALYFIPTRRSGAYRYFRRNLARVILLGLEVLIIADTIRTVIVDQTAESVAVLATVVAVRIALSWSLTVELEGRWPWQHDASVPESGEQPRPDLQTGSG